uniref:Putative secreted peptide n=1 Tax=Anopheles braziliensis TaxID=58242 RepID=A0A2M3ZTN9_9DIPT
MVLLLCMFGLFFRKLNGIRPLPIIRETNNCDIRYRSDQKTHVTSRTPCVLYLTKERNRIRASERAK